MPIRQKSDSKRTSPFPRGRAERRCPIGGVLKQNLLPEKIQVGTPEGTRTPHLLLRRQLLYPDELLAHMERVMGIEPTPTAWKAGALAVVLHPQAYTDESALEY